MAASKKKQEEKHLKLLRELAALPSNKQCFDCNQRGPTYVNMTIGSFVCTSCSGLLRGLNPPFRVKSISMASFTADEIDFIRCRGNEYCRQVWLGKGNSPNVTEFDSKDEQRVREMMVNKYERKRWYQDPALASKSLPSSTASLLANIPETKSLSAITNKANGNYNPLASTNSGVARPMTSSASLSSLSSINRGVPQSASISSLSSMNRPGHRSPEAVGHTVSNANSNFANFENFNTTGSSVTNGSSDPLTSHITQPIIASPPPILSLTNQPPPRDRYAALADLDSLFSTSSPEQTAQEGNPFGGQTNPSDPYSAFGSSTNGVTSQFNMAPEVIPTWGESPRSAAPWGGESSTRPAAPWAGESGTRPTAPWGVETSSRPTAPWGGESNTRPNAPWGGESNTRPTAPWGGESNTRPTAPWGIDSGARQPTPWGIDIGTNQPTPWGMETGARQPVLWGGESGGRQQTPWGGESGVRQQTSWGGEGSGRQAAALGGDSGGRQQVPWGAEGGAMQQTPWGGESGAIQQTPWGADNGTRSWAPQVEPTSSARTWAPPTETNKPWNQGAEVNTWNSGSWTPSSGNPFLNASSAPVRPSPGNPFL